MAADVLSVALAYLTALGGSDPDAVVALVAEDFRNEHFAELGEGSVGRDEYARRLPQFFEEFGDREYEIVETVAGQADIVVNYRFRADVGEVRIEVPGLMWITVRNGEVARRLDCWDSLTFERQTQGD